MIAFNSPEEQPRTGITADQFYEIFATLAEHEKKQATCDHVFGDPYTIGDGFHLKSCNKCGKVKSA